MPPTSSTTLGALKRWRTENGGDIEGDDRTIVNLLTDQVEFANVIILNKIDMVSEEHLGILRGTLQKLNPGAQIVETNFSEVNPTRILNTGLFDFEEAEESAGWIEELNKEEHTPETEEYGIGSFVYRTKLPFDPERFWQFFQTKFPSNIIRSKGLFWIASRPNQALIWGQARQSIRTDSAGLWWNKLCLAHQGLNSPLSSRTRPTSKRHGNVHLEIGKLKLSSSVKGRTAHPTRTGRLFGTRSPSGCQLGRGLHGHLAC